MVLATGVVPPAGIHTYEALIWARGATATDKIVPPITLSGSHAASVVVDGSCVGRATNMVA